MPQPRTKPAADWAKYKGTRTRGGPLSSKSDDKIFITGIRGDTWFLCLTQRPFTSLVKVMGPHSSRWTHEDAGSRDISSDRPTQSPLAETQRSSVDFQIRNL